MICLWDDVDDTAGEISGECSSLNLTVPGLSPPTSQPSPASANQTTNAGMAILEPTPFASVFPVE